MTAGARTGWITATLAAVLLALPAGAGAKTYEPTKTGDPVPGSCRPRDCSLREAVIAANNRPGVDEIALRPGKRYRLARVGADEDEGQTGDLDVTGPLTISSAPRKARIDGAGLDTVIEVHPGARTQLRRIVVSGGEGEDRGGGIHSAARITLVRSAVRGNVGQTGAIESSADIVLRRTRIAGNRTPALDDGLSGGVAVVPGGGGGRVWPPNPGRGAPADVNLTLVRSIIAGNRGGSAGGAAAYGARFSVRRSRIVNNTGYVNGFAEVFGAMTVTRSQISGNRAVFVGSQAGAVSGSGGPIALMRSRITGNRVDGTSGVGAIWIRDASHLRIARSVIAGNFGTRGGGIRADDTPTSIGRSRFTGNEGRNSYGGGFSFEDDGDEPSDPSMTLRVSRTTFNRNRTTGDYAFGGGIAIQGGNATIARSTVSGNRTTGALNSLGGGIFLDRGPYLAPGSLTLVNSTIDSNSSAFGGGIVGGLPAKLNAVTLTRNTASNEGGGASFYFPWTIDNSLLARNTAPTGPDCSGTVTSGGHNLIGNVSGCSGFTGPGDIVRPNPRIGALADNGGPTKTVALLRRSPAINRAGGDAPNRDQRGHKRRNPDIGAFERD